MAKDNKSVRIKKTTQAGALTAEQRKKYLTVRKELSEEHKALVEKIRSSQRLSKEDFAVLINARC